MPQYHTPSNQRNYRMPFYQRFIALSLTLVEQVPSAPQRYRPYAVNTDDQVSLTARWKKLLNDTRGEITPEQLGELSYDTLIPASERGDVVGIPNGWESPRFSFALTFIEETSFGKTVRVAYGYTDTVGVTDGIVDPKMRFYFNRLVTHDRDRITVRHYHNLFRENLHVLTPKRLFDLKQANEIIKNFPGPQGCPDCDVDTRYFIFLTDPVNAIPAKYLCDTVNAYRGALAEIKGTEGEGDKEVLYGEASHKVDPGDAHRDDLYVVLNHRSDYGNKKYISYEELEKIFSGLDDRTLVASYHDTVTLTPPVETEPESQLAAVLKHAIPALMTQAGLRRLHFSVTYDAEHKTGDYHIHEGKTAWIFEFSDDGRHSTDSVVTQLMTEVLKPFVEFTAGGKIIVDADLAGQTTIKISTDGSTWEKHVVPTYGDSLFIPYISQQPTEDYMNALFDVIEPGL